MSDKIRNLPFICTGNSARSVLAEGLMNRSAPGGSRPGPRAATLFNNWAVKPSSMALLGWVVIRHALAPWLPAGQRGWSPERQTPETLRDA